MVQPRETVAPPLNVNFTGVGSDAGLSQISPCVSLLDTDLKGLPAPRSRVTTSSSRVGTYGGHGEVA